MVISPTPSRAEDDEKRFGTAAGTPERQQLWERLAVLIGGDMWSSLGCQERMRLAVRGDNVGALKILVKMRPSSPRLAIVARELALRLIGLVVPARCGTHPGGGSHCR